MASFDFLSKVYETFGFQFKLVLSTRNPNKFLGSLETWNRAETALAEAMDERIGKGKWGLNPEDGAFYGPKVCNACVLFINHRSILLFQMH
jgi:threonyl-tRNA synthetase